MAGSNAILAPIIIPNVASFGITPNTLGVLIKRSIAIPNTAVARFVTASGVNSPPALSLSL